MSTNSNFPIPVEPSDLRKLDKSDPKDRGSVVVRWPASVWISFFGLIAAIIKMLAGS